MVCYCYMVSTVGFDMCIHHGIHKTYDGALRKWNKIRLLELSRYQEYMNEETNASMWKEYVDIYSADTVEEFNNRLAKYPGGMDVVSIYKCILED